MTRAIVLGGSRGIGKAISNALKSIEIDVFDYFLLNVRFSFGNHTFSLL